MNSRTHLQKHYGSLIKKCMLFCIFLQCTVIAADSKCSITAGPYLLKPVSDSNKWESVPMAGVNFHCPTHSENIEIVFGAGYGTLHSSDESSKTKTLLIDISLDYNAFTYRHWSVEAVFSLVSLVIKSQSSNSVKDVSLIAAWENEFGTALGASVVYRPCRHLFLSIPVKYSVIFTSPDYFHLISSGLSIGYQFGSGGAK
jgi:hypothetical protein